jgi:uncharacterized protein YecT (DUF1311 family)
MWPKYFLFAAIALSSTPAWADDCAAYHGNASENQRCLTQLYLYWQQRVRVSVDKAMIAAADKDGTNGYGLHVHLLDGEQSAWEREAENACGIVKVDATEQPKRLACWVSRLQERYELISRK